MKPPRYFAAMKVKLPRFKLPPWLSVLVKAGEQWNSDNAFKHSAAVSFYTLFSLAPLTIIALGLAGFVFGPEVAKGKFDLQISQMIGKESAEVITKAVMQAEPQRKGWWSTAVGVGLLLFGATTVFGQLQDSLNAIWRVAPNPGRNGFVVILLRRLLSFAMVLTVGFLLLVSLVVSTAISAAVELAGQRVTLPPMVAHGIDMGAALIVVTLLFALIFKVLPDVKLLWSDVWRGAFVTSLLFGVGRFGISMYLGHSTITSSYGAAGSLVALLVWVYYSCAILFYGAEFTRVYCEAHGRAITPKTKAIPVQKRMVRKPPGSSVTRKAQAA
jgi:membrane protein